MTDHKADVIMPTQKGQETAILPTKSRLIDALLDAWADMPAEELSVRALVQQAGAAQSAIHYHFDNLEHLYVCASQTALNEARVWMAAQLEPLDVLAGQALPLPLQASLIASLIADWTGPQRRLAMAWRHGCDREWQAAWDEFWHRLAVALDLEAHAGTLACFAAGEAARHLLVWNPRLDRALLEETTAALILWLREGRLTPDLVRPAYQSIVRRGYGAPVIHQDQAVATIAGAAAGLLAEKGHQGVTFRAVAARAGVTLGKVIHVFGTKSALLHVALHSLYEREALGGDVGQLLARTLPPDEMLDELLGAVLDGNQPVLAAYDEIECAIYNGEEHAALRGLVRAMEDPSGTWALQQLLGGRQPSASLVAAFSAIIRGIGHHALHCTALHEELRSYALAALSPFQP
jgi:AcrR family transcriptional regulator